MLYVIGPCIILYTYIRNIYIYKLYIYIYVILIVYTYLCKCDIRSCIIGFLLYTDVLHS